jgi:hypothetical protein
MRSAFFYAVIIGLWGTTAVLRQSPAADGNTPQSKPARAVISKVFHDQRPAKSAPRLLRDVIGNSDVDWSAVAQRASENGESEEFLVTWSANAREKLIIRFEYRQERASGVKAMEEANPKLRGRSHFSVSGDDLKRDGAVTAWRVTILDGEKVLTSKQSFMW